MVSNRNGSSDSLLLAERLLCNLPGVISAKINVSTEGEIVEVHVLTDHNRRPKHIVRDIESALFSGFNIEVDHKRISVAQLRSPENGGRSTSEFRFETFAPGEAGGNEKGNSKPRLRFDRFEIVPVGNLKCSAEVVLSNGGNLYRGVCEDTSTRSNQMKICAKAVLSALEEYLHGEKAFTLEELKIVEEVNSPVVLVVVEAVSKSATVSLVGTSFVRDDMNRAAALATLKAVNRSLGCT